MARAVSEEVCKAVLDEKVWTGEGEEVVWTVQITESVKEKVKGVCTLPLTSPRSHPFHTHASTPFRPPSASAHPGRLCTRLSPHLRPRPALNFPRYKIIVQTTVGQQKQQGVRVVSRCLWDVDVDNCSSYTYQSDTLWATVMVFGLYVE